ncbi:MAG: chorismate mutase [Mycoplasmataceae bacterium]|jgi:monofunctional chorismate mutase|nr:chorismate mutase [Mycoplasmataceae bacterium]
MKTKNKIENQANEDLELYRSLLCEIDEKIIELFLKRLELSKKIGAYKKANNLPIFVLAQEEKVLSRVRHAVGTKMSPGSIEEIYKIIMNESKKVQK